ncbi:hypothetical protein D3C77_263570 [compost metagenome]
MRGTADFDRALSVDGNTFASVYRACAHMYPGTFSAAENPDAPRLHGAEQAGVDTASGGCEVINHLSIGVADKIASNGQVQVVPGGEWALAVDAWGNQLEGAVEVALATRENLQGAGGIAAVEVFDALFIKLGAADQKTRAGGVDEAATVEGNAVGVSQYVIGRSAEDFLASLDA